LLPALDENLGAGFLTPLPKNEFMDLKKSVLHLLFFLAAKGGAYRFVGETTSSAAKGLGVPQQTVSRWAIELEEKGFLERGEAGFRLTERAVEELRGIYSELSAAFGEERVSRLEGSVVSGLGDGAYYVSRKRYLEQFRRKLGFTPFPGTLNIRLRGADDVAERMRLSKTSGIRIRGFVEEKHVFGGATCFPAVLHGARGRAGGAVIVPERSHYGTEVTEFISPKNLRKALSLRDGDLVAIEFFYPKTSKIT